MTLLAAYHRRQGQLCCSHSVGPGGSSCTVTRPWLPQVSSGHDRASRGSILCLSRFLSSALLLPSHSLAIRDPCIFSTPQSNHYPHHSIPMAEDTEIPNTDLIAGYEVYTGSSENISSQNGVPHPLGELFNIVSLNPVAITDKLRQTSSRSRRSSKSLRLFGPTTRALR
jgi:hypothetical protein